MLAKHTPSFGRLPYPQRYDLVRRQFVQRLAFKQDLAGAWPHQAGNTAYRGAFARPVRADHADDLALIDFKRNAI